MVDIFWFQILISNSKNEYGDAPYVRQPEGCGKPGRYMHLTPAYITNNSVSAKWGPRGKGHVMMTSWRQPVCCEDRMRSAQEKKIDIHEELL